MRRTAPLLAPVCTLALGVVGCAESEQDLAVDVRVIVPVSVQQQFSLERPGRIVVYSGGLEVGARLGGLCDPTSEPLSYTTFFGNTGCREESSVAAWIESLDPRGDWCELAPSTHYPPQPWFPPDGAPLGFAVIFAGERAPPCRAGTTEATVTIELDD